MEIPRDQGGTSWPASRQRNYMKQDRARGSRVGRDDRARRRTQIDLSLQHSERNKESSRQAFFLSRKPFVCGQGKNSQQPTNLNKTPYRRNPIKKFRRVGRP
jgi:hypothetical protein